MGKRLAKRKMAQSLKYWYYKLNLKNIPICMLTVPHGNELAFTLQLS